MGKIYVVATPIGNLGDITLRAIDILKDVDAVACEDTRITSKLLSRYNIKKRLISYHQHSRAKKINEIIDLLKSNNDIALVSDAGTPGVSDPGRKLLNAVYRNGIEIEVVPGPSALSAALSICDFDTKEFVFYGFLPHKKGRQTKLKEIVAEKKAVVIYESVYRIKKLLNEILELSGDRKVFIGRELTKRFETVYRGKITEIMDTVVEKGEFVVVLEGKDVKK